MPTLRNNLTATILFIIAQIAVGQELPFETVTREVNRQIFDTDGQLPGFHTLTNKYHGFNYGRIQSETIVYSTPNERAIRYYNQQGSMVKYQVYLNEKLRSDFIYKYDDDGISLLKERGTYNLDYFRTDSINSYGLPVGDGRGFAFDLDTLYVSEGKFSYELTKKRKSPKKSIDRYVTKYTKNGSILSVQIFKNEVQTGHTINKYNTQEQVIERQDFWDYWFFANEDEWSEYLSNRVYKFSYDSNGLIKTLVTEVYNPIERKWKIQTQAFQCSIESDNSLYIGRCKCSGEDYLVVTIDTQGNWIRKEVQNNGQIELSTRSITYYE